MALALGMLGFPIVHASVSTPSSSNPHQALPTLGSINQLGELHYTIPKLERFRTINGVPVIAVITDDLPIVDVTVEFGAGSAHDEHIRAGAQGVAAMTALMLTQGIASSHAQPAISEDAFVAAKEELGIKLSAQAGRDSLSVYLRSLTNSTDEPTRLDDALSLLLGAITRPAFDDKVLTRNKTRAITSLKQRQQSPNYIASTTFAKALFGTHPYAHQSVGTEESLASLTSTDLRAFKDRYLVATNARITITGKLTLAQAERIANMLATSLPQGIVPQHTPAPTAPRPTHIHLDHPSPQTHIIMGHLSPPIPTDETSLQAIQTFELANEVVAGGEFSARLMDQIRVKDGYTYGIHGSRSSLRAAGLYALTFSTEAAHARDAIDKTIAVINDTRKTGIRAHELTLVKNNARHSLPMQYASNAHIHSLVSTMNNLDMPDSYLTHQSERIERVDLKSVNDSLIKNIRPQDFIIITVGKDKPDLSHLFTRLPTD